MTTNSDLLSSYAVTGFLGNSTAFLNEVDKFPKGNITSLVSLTMPNKNLIYLTSRKN